MAMIHSHPPYHRTRRLKSQRILNVRYFHLPHPISSLPPRQLRRRRFFNSSPTPSQWSFPLKIRGTFQRHPSLPRYRFTLGKAGRFKFLHHRKILTATTKKNPVTKSSKNVPCLRHHLL